MSYEIVKTISLDKAGKCFVTSASNNCYPHTYEKWEFKFPDEVKTLTDKEKYILLQFENGNLQKGNSKFLKAVNYACSLPEYSQYCWRINNSRDEEALKEFLYSIYKDLPAKGKFILVAKNALYPDSTRYLKKVNFKTWAYTYDIMEAKIYNYEFEAKNQASKSYMQGYEVQKLDKKAEVGKLYEVEIKLPDEIINYQQHFRNTKRAFTAIKRKYSDWQGISIQPVRA